eukprot:TRINITY_DN8411_c0_g2_i1.p1 TRINITY_DN8411_c0_g2~~TRINITY_DN8411_c0_g2_i1.p1  ORF type:complete len:301 (-),score=63.86 TRINITY_DN8411_c0_g2_i1:113-964(-)
MAPAAASDDLKRLTAVQNLLLGTLAGCGSKCVNYPLLTWKNTVQQGLPISFNPSVVYRGLPVALLNIGGTTAIQFWFTGAFQKLYSGGNALTPGTQMAAALSGGALSGVPCSIWELTMIQQQRYGGSLFGTPARLIKEFGASSILRGVTMTIGRESLFTMAMLGLCPVLQRSLSTNYGLEKSVALAAGSLAGATMAGTITHPMDTIKTCMQGDVARVKYTNVVETGKLLMAEYGVAQGLFKGLQYRIGLISTTFFLVNKMKMTLLPVLFPIEEPVIPMGQAVA